MARSIAHPHFQVSVSSILICLTCQWQWLSVLTLFKMGEHYRLGLRTQLSIHMMPMGNCQRHFKANQRLWEAEIVQIFLREMWKKKKRREWWSLESWAPSFATKLLCVFLKSLTPEEIVVLVDLLYFPLGLKKKPEKKKCPIKDLFFSLLKKRCLNSDKKESHRVTKPNKKI